MTAKKGKGAGKGALHLHPQSPQVLNMERSDALADKEYAVLATAEGLISYVDFDNLEAADKSADSIWTGLESVFDAGDTSYVRVVVLKIIRIKALDRLPEEEREVGSDEADGNTGTLSFDDDVQRSL
jgi:hypothetical protein